MASRQSSHILSSAPLRSAWVCPSAGAEAEGGVTNAVRASGTAGTSGRLPPAVGAASSAAAAAAATGSTGRLGRVDGRVATPAPAATLDEARTGCRSSNGSVMPLSERE
jgi:hypothetical protein